MFLARSRHFLRYAFSVDFKLAGWLRRIRAYGLFDGGHWAVVGFGSQTAADFSTTGQWWRGSGVWLWSLRDWGWKWWRSRFSNCSWCLCKSMLESNYCIVNFNCVGPHRHTEFFKMFLMLAFWLRWSGCYLVVSTLWPLSLPFHLKLFFQQFWVGHMGTSFCLIWFIVWPTHTVFFTASGDIKFYITIWIIFCTIWSSRTS